jgi:hypothetical protein
MGFICLENFFQPLTLSQCLFFSVRWVSCKQHMVVSCFLTQFAILCLLIGALRPFTFSVNIERCLLFPVILVSLLFSFTYSLFICLLAQKCLFFLESSYLCLVFSSVCKSPLSIFCSAGLVVTNSFSFSLLWKVWISPSIRKDGFSGLTSLGWELLSFRAWITFFHDYLAFRVWVDKSAIILMGLPLYVTCLFSFAAFRILSIEYFDYGVSGGVSLLVLSSVWCSVGFLHLGDSLSQG